MGNHAIALSKKYRNNFHKDGLLKLSPMYAFINNQKMG